MENLNAVPDQPTAVGWNPSIGEPEPGVTPNHNPLPASNGEGPATTEPPKPPTPPSTPAPEKKTPAISAAQYAAAAKAPEKTTKKPLLDPEKYRKAKAPAAEEVFSDGAQSTIPVRKPGSRNFFRAHPDEEYRLYNVPVVEDDQHEWHIIAADLEIPEDVERFISHVNLITCLNHKGTLFLWPYKNSTNDWSKSASRIVRRAVGEWVRLSADMDANGYRIEIAPAELRAVEPAWPRMTFEEILNTAFEDKSIDSLNHPVIRSIRGLGYGPAN
jgi:hypothetical protein